MLTLIHSFACQGHDRWDMGGFEKERRRPLSRLALVNSSEGKGSRRDFVSVRPSGLADSASCSVFRGHWFSLHFAVLAEIFLHPNWPLLDPVLESDSSVILLPGSGYPGHL